MNNYYNTGVSSWYTARTHEDNVTMRELIIIILYYFLASEIGRRRNTAARLYVHVHRNRFSIYFPRLL